MAAVALPALHIPTAAELSAWFADLQLIESLTAAWTPLVPTWGSSGTAPALGTGTLAAQYAVAGKLGFYKGKLTWGSTTTGGTGTWTMTLPPGWTLANFDSNCGSAFFFDSSTPATRQSGSTVPSNSTSIGWYSSTGQLAATVPITWASGDQLRWALVAELS